MSVRTFTRRFRDETGVSPVRWLTDRRVELARRLLETTELPVDRVAQRAGFGTPTALRQQLHAAIGVAPDLPAHLPRGALSGAGTCGEWANSAELAERLSAERSQRRASLAQVASWRSKRSRRMRWSTYSSPVTPARNGVVNVVTITVTRPIAM